jgi:general stress protein CsbA
MNEAIVQAQYLLEFFLLLILQMYVTFIHYVPSHIAISAFLAAAKIEYPSKYNEIAKDIKRKIGLQAC